MKFVKPLNLFKESLKRKAIPPIYDCCNYEKSGGFIGLNVGDNSVALAMSDPENINVAIPLRALPMQQNKMGPVAKKLKSLGPPVTKFIDDLCKTGKLKGIKYTYWDGNITSKRSEFIYAHHVNFVSAHSELSIDMSKEIVDNLAAVPILQGYLDCAKTLVAQCMARKALELDCA